MAADLCIPNAGLPSLILVSELVQNSDYLELEKITLATLGSWQCCTVDVCANH